MNKNRSTPEENLKAILASSSYTLAEEDTALLKAKETRPTRMQLELLKPELVFQEQGIRTTIVLFGGTRIVCEEDAEKKVADAETELAGAPDDTGLQQKVSIAKRILAKAHYYEVAREFARIVSERTQGQGINELVIVTGGGPGIMEAGNRGAWEVGAKSIGLNVTIPREQVPNSYITPELCFQFHYFALRKMHFLMRARAMVACPGGYGTLDELFETLTLIQTGKMRRIPIILLGREFWSRVVDFDFLVAEGTINPEDLELVTYAETADEIADQITEFYGHNLENLLDLPPSPTDRI